ncbi:GntR family transcriptional regulator [Paracoccus shanxieyensis]|uniref:FCD domain-containing protein n=1 Tax=Paracoccus shanxieyensis TaxID=2675752 RepID=A0A6L6IZG3_9RHOB|nr:GntR family transcriptional regulator [Paracoccus shanxieyensis]MTH65916.1 FCD domain-containing protein [Paracoccus shanxieyensis]MTH89175.1 FCD domain-containing protein [Paracoccus shanxieyensis]
MSLDKLRPISRQSTETLVTDNLRDFILSGEIAPGGRLTEIALADQLGVARSTLRMGLHRLAAEGIVVQTPYTGWHVASLSAADVWEIWTLRGSLESLASRLAAERTQPEIRAQLDAAFDAFLGACERGVVHEMSKADFAMHRAIVDCSGHRRLAAQYRLVEQQVRLFIATSNTHVATGPDDIIAQHMPLIGAIRARDGEAAAKAAWEHDATEGARLMDWIARQPPPKVE